MFFGSYEYNLDDKGRILLPTKFRNEIGEKLYLIKGYEGCISLFKQDDFDRYITNLQNLPYESRKVRQYQRILLQSVVELSIDKVGRILIPSKTLKEYQIGKSILLLGSIDHLEVWDLEKWYSYKEENEQNFELDAESLIKTNENWFPHSCNA